jgi:hypothetical protein
MDKQATAEVIHPKGRRLAGQAASAREPVG